MSVLSIEVPDSMYDRFSKTNGAIAITLSHGDTEGGYGWYVRGIVELLEEMERHAGPRTPYTRSYEVTARTQAHFGNASDLPKQTLLFPHEYPILKEPYSTCGNCKNYDHGECMVKRRRETDECTRADSCTSYREQFI